MHCVQLQMSGPLSQGKILGQTEPLNQRPSSRSKAPLYNSTRSSHSGLNLISFGPNGGRFRPHRAPRHTWLTACANTDPGKVPPVALQTSTAVDKSATLLRTTTLVSAISMASPYLTGCQRRGSPENYLWIPFPRTSDISQSNSETMKPQSTKNPKQERYVDRRR